MATNKPRFKQSDVTRAVKAVEAAGRPVDRIEIKPDGSIIAYTGSEIALNGPDAAFEAWERQ